MSIRPEYASAIMDGRKRVEFRKRRLRSDIRVVVVYASAPVQRVVGCFTVAQVDEGHPDDLWKRYQAVGGIGVNAFRSYYGRSTRAVAIRVGKVARLETPLPLSALGEGLVPPQSFCYLDGADLRSALAGLYEQSAVELSLGGELGKRRPGWLWGLTTVLRGVLALLLRRA